MSRRMFCVLVILTMIGSLIGPAPHVRAAAPGIPGKVEAHSFGTAVTIDWEYTYTPSLLSSLSFEVQEFKLSGMIVTWVDVGTVAYPTKTLTLEGLSTGQHKFRVRAVESMTMFRPFPLGPVTTTTPSAYSAEVSAWVLTAPAGADVHRASSTSKGIRVTWAGLDAAATHYEILRAPVSLLPIRPSVIHDGPRTDTSWVDGDADPNRKYSYYVRAVKAGTESSDKDISSQSSAGSITTPPDPPALQLAYSSGRTITVSWTHSGSCDKFHVWSKPVSVADPVMPVILPSTQRSYVIADAQYGKWMVDMAAWGEGGYSPDTASLDVWVLTTPPTPLAVVVGSTAVKLTWAAPDANASTVRILRSVSAGPFVALSTVGAGVTTFTDTSCLAGTVYAYKLQAAKDDDTSELSPASSSVTTSASLSKPAKPTNLVATAQSSLAVGLTWTDNADNEEVYRVYRRDGTYIPFGQVSPDLPAGTTSWQDGTVTPSSLYTYMVRAVNAAGDSDWSNEAGVTTPAEPVTPPAAPTTLTGVAGTPRSVELIWSDNSSNEVGFRIERRTGAGAWTQVAATGADAIKWMDEGVVPTTVYSYRVKAHNAGGESAWSNEFTVTTPSDVQTVVIKLVIDKKTYTVNGVSMMMDVAPVILESRTLGPVRYIAEALGAGVVWDPVERKVTLTRGSRMIELWISKNTARVDGVFVLIDPENPEVKPLILPPGRTMLPFRFIAEQLGAGVGWDPVKREVTITYPGS